MEEGFLGDALKSTPRTDITNLHVRESDISVIPGPAVGASFPREGPVELPGRTGVLFKAN
jgi:hypothetical protein